MTVAVNSDPGGGAIAARWVLAGRCLEGWDDEGAGDDALEAVRLGGSSSPVGALLTIEVAAGAASELYGRAAVATGARLEGRGNGGGHEGSGGDGIEKLHYGESVAMSRRLMCWKTVDGIAATGCGGRTFIYIS